MDPIRAHTAALLLVVMAATGCATLPHGHRAHDGVPAQAGPLASAEPDDARRQCPHMLARMEQLNSPHGKIQSAQTLQERQALMAAHMKSMHERMSNLRDMGCAGAGSGTSETAAAMRHRIETMEMQMDIVQQLLQAVTDMMLLSPPAQ